jgi:hypothetical protein
MLMIFLVPGVRNCTASDSAVQKSVPDWYRTNRSLSRTLAKINVRIGGTIPAPYTVRKGTIAKPSLLASRL